METLIDLVSDGKIVDAEECNKNLIENVKSSFVNQYIQEDGRNELYKLCILSSIIYMALC